jgi:hypothetical protein
MQGKKGREQATGDRQQATGKSEVGIGVKE